MPVFYSERPKIQAQKPGYPQGFPGFPLWHKLFELQFAGYGTAFDLLAYVVMEQPLTFAYVK